MSTLTHWQQQLIDLAIKKNALLFGSFTLKSGRNSPYFFNAGMMLDAESLHTLSYCYSKAVQNINLTIDTIFGPAYKGIVLGALCTNALHASNPDLGFAYDRKEAKTHGEGGQFVGDIRGNVLIVDDVVSAGTAIGKSIELIKQENAHPCAALVALDRNERGSGTMSTRAEFEQKFGIKIHSIIQLNHIIQHLEQLDHPSVDSIHQYQAQYGAPS